MRAQGNTQEAVKDGEESEHRHASALKFIEAPSDLVPRVYEGGLKTWECSIDLVEYLYSTEGQRGFRGKGILEVPFQNFNRYLILIAYFPAWLWNSCSVTLHLTQPPLFYAAKWRSTIPGNHDLPTRLQRLRLGTCHPSQHPAHMV